MRFGFLSLLYALQKKFLCDIFVDVKNQAKKQKTHADVSSLKVVRIVNPNSRTIKKISQWLFDWWGKDEGYSFAAIRTYTANSVQNSDYPQTFGLFLKNKLIGMFQIALDDLFVCPNLHPWLANVFVLKEYRGFGFGKFLVSQAIKVAKQMQIPKIYLYTNMKNFYEKFGFVFLKNINTFSTVFKTSKLYEMELKNDNNC